MSWVDEARNEARLMKLEKEERERQRQIALKRRLDFCIDIFRSATRETRLEIEKILDELRKKGFNVSKAKEGDVEDNDKDSGSYLHSDNEGDRGYDDRRASYAFAIKWNITEPSRRLTLSIYLGLNRRNGKSSSFEDFTGNESPNEFIPSVTAQEIRGKIKSWLIGLWSQ